ncbi:MAG: hypothetical protein KGD67_08850 [Candidatus Lokiarchaeota archaeon]|nr:hypothetical protein [Candidatus Lokiarchaeota archaeon]
MFKSTKPCLCEETNGSHSNAVIGILIITISLSVGLSVLGVWVKAFDGSQEDSFDLPLIPEKKSLDEIISDESSSEFKNSEDLSTEINSVGLSLEHSEDIFSDAAISGLCDVSVPECGSFGGYDTVPGTMEIVGIPNLPTEPLPLCIDDVSQWSITVRTTGGYEPKGGSITVTQGVGDKAEYRGTLLINHDDGTPVAGVCGAMDYVLTFSLCDGPIILDSNHVPESPLGDFCVWPDKTLEKEVYLSVNSIWEGCRLPDQEFVVILAHKAMSQNPKLPILKTSPVKS